MRKAGNWLQSYMEYCQGTEAPDAFHFWTGVVTIAGALQRKTWINQRHFIWVPNFYVFLVAPPGIATKSSCIRIGRSLLQAVDGVHFGPNMATMPALVDAFEEGQRFVTMPDGELFGYSSVTCYTAELGNFFNPQDREMIDVLVELWDAQDTTFSKHTRHHGKQSIANPALNWIAGTTPSWLVGYVPEYIIGGGFTSRSIFVYEDKKAQYIPYPDETVESKDHAQRRSELEEDLREIAEFMGPFSISKEARQYGHAWYKEHWENPPKELVGTRHESYLARKQTHVHKLAMVLSAAKRDTMVIEEEDLREAVRLVSSTEPFLLRAFEHVGATVEGRATARLIETVKSAGMVSRTMLWRVTYNQFRDREEFNRLLDGAIFAGYLRQVGRDIHYVHGAEEIPGPRTISLEG